MDPSHLINVTPLRPRRPDHEDARDDSSDHPATHALPGEGRAVSTSDPFMSHATATTAARRVGHNVTGNDSRVSMMDDANGEFAAAEAAPPRREDWSYIWGTDIAVELFRHQFRQHLESYEDDDSSSSSSNSNINSRTCAPGGKYYLKEMLLMHLQSRTTLELQMSWMSRAAPQLYHSIVQHPTECLQMITTVAEELYREVLHSRHGIVVSDDLILTVAPKQLNSLVTIKELSPSHVEQLLGIKGMVTRVSKIIPEIRVACFRCWNCQYTERSVSGDKGRIFEPTRCTHCGKTYSFRLQHNLSLFEDKQLIKLQESPEHVSDGETPVSISVVVYGDLVDAVVPGDRVIVTGIYRAAAIRLNANTRIVKSIFSTHVDAVHVEHIRTSRQTARATTSNTKNNSCYSNNDSESHARRSTAAAAAAAVCSAARADVFHKLAQRPDIESILMNSLAPTVWGHDDVKRGILAQLFGGTPKSFRFSRTSDEDSDSHSNNNNGSNDNLESNSSSVSGPSGAVSFRSELNIILCGDPGVAKSQLLTQVHEIAPRGIYTSGKGSSSVGLTAFVVHDSDTGELVLEPGALVLSDRGLCCIDEFDKMNEATRSVLHEVMEQQTISIAKAGIIAQLNARTSILAAANPKDSQWNVNVSVVDNLQLEPTLLSRFDLIFVLLDRHDAAEDRRLAAHVLSLYIADDTGKSSLRPQADAASSTSHSSHANTGDGGDSNRHVLPSEDPDEDGLPPASSCTPLHAQILLAHDKEVFLYGPTHTPRMPLPILSEYISRARDTVYPALTAESHDQLARGYVELRRARGANSRTVSATLRQLESMIRLAEARAKMRYAATVSVEDVCEALRLMRAALKESATDPRTGRINLDLFHAPDPNRNTVEGNMRRLEELLEKRYRGSGRTSVSVMELRNAINEFGSSAASGGGGRAAARVLSLAALQELLTLMSGGDHVESFTASTVTLSERLARA